MKLLFLTLIFSLYTSAFVVDQRYDNYDGDILVLKLIEDTQWETARSVFSGDAKVILQSTPASYHLIQGFFFLNEGDSSSAKDAFEKSLTINYSHLAIEKILPLYASQKQWQFGLDWLTKYENALDTQNFTAEILFLKLAAHRPDLMGPILAWTEKQLVRKFDFQLFKFKIELFVKNHLLIQAIQDSESALLQKKLKSAEDILTIADIFISNGLDSQIYSFLDVACLYFPKNDLIKLNLAQIMFKKDMLLNALNLLSDVKPDDSLINVQLELMNLMHVRSYSLFHRLQLSDNDSHVKNWLVYLINNEDWALLYSLKNTYSGKEKWANDEFNYALAYSAQIMDDVASAKDFALKIKSPNLALKKEKLLKSLAQ